MKLTVQKKLGRNIFSFEVEGANLHSLVLESEKLAFKDVEKCGICEGTNLTLHAYVTKEEKYEYTKVECVDCRATVTFGRRKDEKDTFFLRKNDNFGLDWVEYKKEQKVDEKTPKEQGVDEKTPY